MLRACTCTLSTFEMDEDGIWVRVDDDICTSEVDGVSLSTPPHSQHNNSPLLQPLQLKHKQCPKP